MATNLAQKAGKVSGTKKKWCIELDLEVEVQSGEKMHLILRNSFRKTLNTPPSTEHNILRGAESQG